MQPFMRRKRDRIWAEFTYFEARLLVTLTGQVGALLSDRHAIETADPDPLASVINAGAPATEPDDPVLARLLPSAYRDDFEDAADFRRLTERSLAEHKLRNSQLIVDTLREAGFDPDIEDGPVLEVELTESSALGWLTALNDVRLALSIRLGITDEQDSSDLLASADDSKSAMAEIYEWLGFIQESLVGSIRVGN